MRSDLRINGRDAVRVPTPKEVGIRSFMAAVNIPIGGFRTCRKDLRGNCILDESVDQLCGEVQQ